MKNKKLKIGKISYANLFPIYYYLEKECECLQYEFIEGVPSELNRLLRDGKIDVSPSSSIEYLRHKNKYSLIKDISLSSSGPIGSIFLFSKFPLPALNGKTIAVSPHSETSVMLLKIILEDFLSVRCTLRSLSGELEDILSSFSACLLIGDDAMKEAKRMSGVRSQESEEKTEFKKIRSLEDKNLPTSQFLNFSTSQSVDSSLYIYDLGELWFKHTGLPFVFALWIVRRESLSAKKELIERFSSELINAKKFAAKKISLMAKHAPQRQWLTEEELVNYWKGISYDFTEEHSKGLNMFEQYVKKHEG